MIPNMAILLGFLALLNSLNIVCLRMVARLSACAPHRSRRHARNSVIVCLVFSLSLISCTITSTSVAEAVVQFKQMLLNNSWADLQHSDDAVQDNKITS